MLACSISIISGCTSTAIDLARFPDHPGQRQGVVAVAAAHVTHHHAGLHLELLAHQRGGLLTLAHTAHQPLRPFPVHRHGHLAAHVLGQRRRHLLGGQIQGGEKEQADELAHDGGS
jgi:hypothetical protein